MQVTLFAVLGFTIVYVFAMSLIYDAHKEYTTRKRLGRYSPNMLMILDAHKRYMKPKGPNAIVLLLMIVVYFISLPVVINLVRGPEASHSGPSSPFVDYPAETASNPPNSNRGRSPYTGKPHDMPQDQWNYVNNRLSSEFKGDSKADIEKASRAIWEFERQRISRGER